MINNLATMVGSDFVKVVESETGLKLKKGNDAVILMGLVEDEVVRKVIRACILKLSDQGTVNRHELFSNVAVKALVMYINWLKISDVDKIQGLANLIPDGDINIREFVESALDWLA